MEISKEKQIEEMAKIILEENGGLIPDYYRPDAEALYNAGYRKQSEGEWEKRTFIIFDSEKVGYRCSECNTTWDANTNYCPNCGARMSGGKNE